MARQSKKEREIRLVAQAHREAEDRLRRAYRRLWQTCWEQQDKKQERCEDGKESSSVCPGIDNSSRTGRDTRKPYSTLLQRLGEMSFDETK